MQIIDLKFSTDTLEKIFPCDGEEGQDVRHTPEAERHALLALNLVPSECAALKWHLPDVFAVRYGSSYVGSATHIESNRVVRFHSTEGDFREEDVE